MLRCMAGQAPTPRTLFHLAVPTFRVAGCSRPSCCPHYDNGKPPGPSFCQVQTSNPQRWHCTCSKLDLDPGTSPLEDAVGIHSRPSDLRGSSCGATDVASADRRSEPHARMVLQTSLPWPRRVAVREVHRRQVFKDPTDVTQLKHNPRSHFVPSAEPTSGRLHAGRCGRDRCLQQQNQPKPSFGSEELFLGSHA